MSDASLPGAVPVPKTSSLLVQDARTAKRNAAEARFKMYGLAAVITGILALVLLLASILSNGLSAFQQTYVTLEIALPEDKLDKSGTRDLEVMRKVSTFGYAPLIATAMEAKLAEAGIEIEGLTAKDAGAIISKDAPAQLRDFVLANPQVVGTTQTFELLANGRIDGYLKGRVSMESASLDKNVSPAQLQLTDALLEEGALEKRFNWGFFTNPDASGQRPEAAGLGVAIMGSLYMMMIVLCLALPIGVAASIYLEEFAPKNRLTDLIEVNISNLAAVPSIVFGILGLAIFINFAGLPQSAPIVGGLVLTLMTLPTIIISTRASLKSVPPSIRDAALGVGASKMQAVFHNVLPLAAPGILTGTIIGLAQALGETAPLLLIGMVAFVREYPAAPPEGFFDPASALPVQIYNWTQRSDPAFVERASGAIIVLLVFLLIMNAVAILLRRRFERRW
ncbi:phosphate transport system permease protein [Dinoroseobacter shibae DFL 12 = DSM 16493]|jgi:phosphate transport system permease protein|uniref:Phosphate transport system permease protein PstA n=1 Tax=Dinoroseobacter shibae (strain DSM 16493 / NCIMB 14021 / DFL 12) TaxID=398580 RepID=A8LK78_DINSH|nr:phosphate ABC transporter permease PstA [Dinoroseobacter shibae]ABV93277.1 phosphate transport system permease protein [Dinoroseobacter shibae DFL 12 = DSM 16493]URF48197.1 phosphate ABC transporter permease PstA [Dinoroseobacter shibae]URF52507.1 phosphate ABC transporter permease PstA [Dinoroseobacter shibae]